MILEDGKGTGYKQRVDQNNQAWVRSRSVNSEEDSATNGDAYIIHAVCRTAAATGGALLYIKNNETDDDLHVHRIYFDTFALTDTDLRCLQIFDAVPTGGTTLAGMPLQKNRGSAKAFDVTVKVSDASADMTYTGGAQYQSFALNSRTSLLRDMNGTNIIPAGKSILWAFVREGGGVATDNQQVSFSINITLVPK